MENTGEIRCSSLPFIFLSAIFFLSLTGAGDSLGVQSTTKKPPPGPIRRTARFRLELRGLLAAKVKSTGALLVDHEAEIAAAGGPLVVADSWRSVGWSAAFINRIVAIMVKNTEAGLCADALGQTARRLNVVFFTEAEEAPREQSQPMPAPMIVPS